MKYILTLSMVMLICVSSIAQHNRQDRKKLESLRIAYITDELDLSSEEAQIFWPVFNEFEKKRTELRKSKNMLLGDSSKNSSDIVTEYLAIEEEEHILNENYITQMREVISDEKIITLISSEKRFRERLIKRLNSKRRDR